MPDPLGRPLRLPHQPIDWNKGNPLEGFTDEQIKAEARRRGLLQEKEE